MPDLIKVFTRLSDKNKALFSEYFMSRYLRSNFGVLTKREIELILIQAFKEMKFLDGLSNYEQSALLGINERRLRGLLLDASIKYGENTTRNSISYIIKSLIIKGSNKFELENGYIIFSLEDPIYRRDFDNELHKLGYFSDSSFRADIVKVKDVSFVAFLYHHYDDTYKDLKKRLQESAADKKDLLRPVNASGSWKKKAESVFKTLTDVKEKAGFITAVIAFFKGILL